MHVCMFVKVYAHLREFGILKKTFPAGVLSRPCSRLCSVSEIIILLRQHSQMVVSRGRGGGWGVGWGTGRGGRDKKRDRQRAINWQRKRRRGTNTEREEKREGSDTELRLRCMYTCV